MMTVDTLSARDRKVKKEIRMRMPTTADGTSEKGAGCCWRWRCWQWHLAKTH
jgi:hypothetical protein